MVLMSDLRCKLMASHTFRQTVQTATEQSKAERWNVNEFLAEIYAEALTRSEDALIHALMSGTIGSNGLTLVQVDELRRRYRENIESESGHLWPYSKMLRMPLP